MSQDSRILAALDWPRAEASDKAREAMAASANKTGRRDGKDALRASAKAHANTGEEG